MIETNDNASQAKESLLPLELLKDDTLSSNPEFQIAFCITRAAEAFLYSAALVK